MEKKIFGGILAGSLVAVGGFFALMVLGLDPKAAFAYIGGLTVAVGFTIGLALAGGFELKWGIKIAYVAGFAVTTLIPIAAVVAVLQAREAAERQAILANQDQQTVMLYQEGQKLAGRDKVLGGDEATLIAEEAKRDQTLIEAQKLAADLAAGQGEDVQAWKVKERAALLHGEETWTEWLSKRLSFQETISMAERVMNVPYWLGIPPLLGLSILGGIIGYFLWRSLKETTFGEGVPKPVKPAAGATNGAWILFVLACIWYGFDRFVVRWAGKYAAITIGIFIGFRLCLWWYPDHPLPGSAMWRAQQQAVAAAQTTATPAPVVAPPTAPATMVRKKAPVQKSLHEIKCGLPGAERQYPSCRSK